MSMTEDKIVLANGISIAPKWTEVAGDDCIPTVKSVRRMIRDEVRAMFLRLLDDLGGDECDVPTVVTNERK